MVRFMKELGWVVGMAIIHPLLYLEWILSGEARMATFRLFLLAEERELR